MLDRVFTAYGMEGAMSEAFKCDICRQFAERGQYKLPHPEVNKEIDACEQCWEEWQREYQKWLEKKGVRPSTYKKL